MYLAGLGHVVFTVKSEQDEFPEYELKLPTVNNQVLLESVANHLDMHSPPLRPRTVDGVPVTARPGDKTLAITFKDGDRLELVAKIASPGKSSC